MFGAIIKGIIGGGLDNVLTERLIPDREGRKKAQRAINELAAKAIAAGEVAEAQDRQAQLQINLAEAAHRNLFVAGWRPAVGWVCAIGVGWTFLGYPVADFVLQASGREMALPAIPEDNVMELLIALLGMGTLRSVEKWKGVARKM